MGKTGGQETTDVVANARAKLAAKGVDLLVVNDVSQRGIGFDAEDNEVLLIDRWGGELHEEHGASLLIGRPTGEGGFAGIRSDAEGKLGHSCQSIDLRDPASRRLRGRN